VADPLEATANNFVFALPPVLAVSALFLGDLRVTPAGFALAAVSGALASGLGYVVWYAALRGPESQHIFVHLGGREADGLDQWELVGRGLQLAPARLGVGRGRRVQLGLGRLGAGLGGREAALFQQLIDLGL